MHSYLTYSLNHSLNHLLTYPLTHSLHHHHIYQVDVKSFSQGHDCLRKAICNLTTGFQAAVKTAPISDPTSKKVAIFGVTNCLFKIYFKLDTLHLCGKLINAVERPGPESPMQNLQRFPLVDVVTYKFYIGKLRMFEDKYVEARYFTLFRLHNSVSV
jgi:hypothetical protein